MCVCVYIFILVQTNFILGVHNYFALILLLASSISSLGVVMRATDQLVEQRKARLNWHIIVI